MNYPKPIYIPQTTSTNVSLADICSKGEADNLTSVYSSFQTDGRGQRGNKWESEDGKNLLFSFVTFPKGLPAKEHFILLQITALALFDTLTEYTDGISIKWPNDIYCMDKKICGTLIEKDLSGMNIERSISGTGVNLNQKIFRSGAPNPISLSLISIDSRFERELRVLRNFLIEPFCSLRSDPLLPPLIDNSFGIG